MKNNTDKKTRKNFSRASARKKRAEPLPPQWTVEAAERGQVGQLDFHYMRKAAHMTLSQCADYLRVPYASVKAWESGAEPLPFMAWELLRMIQDNRNFLFAHPRWRTWRMNDRGELCHPEQRRGFTADELRAHWIRVQQMAHQDARIKDLEAAANRLSEENTKLRQMFVSQGLVDELAAMQSKIGALLTRINTAKVIPFAAVETKSRKGKAA